MRVIVQKALNASCTVSDSITGKIDKGYMLLVGFTHSDTIENCKKMASKIAKLRIFEDSDDKMNLNIKDVNGKILSISQFTLYANPNDGNRPSFTDAMRPDEASALYKEFNNCLRNEGLVVEEGIFQAHMLISFTNDGPTTIILEN